MTTSIKTAEEFNSYPVGTVFRDGDGWKHTKVRDAVLDEDGQNHEAHTTDYVDSNGDKGTFGNPWSYGPLTVESLPKGEEIEATPRPLIDFSGSSRATARQYAYDLQSRVNKTETDQVLSQVAEGQQVDAYVLAEALLDAQRGCLTRFGQSLSRRRAGEKVAHLGYIAHGVLANHADSLPAYEQGERSRAVNSWREIATSHQTHIETLTAEAEERDRLLGEAAEALAEARSEVEKGTEFRQHANDEVTRLLLKLSEQTERAEQAERERDAAAATISYVVEALDPEWQQRVIGYWDGVKDATFPSTEG